MPKTRLYSLISWYVLFVQYGKNKKERDSAFNKIENLLEKHFPNINENAKNKEQRRYGSFDFVNSNDTSLIFRSRYKNIDENGNVEWVNFELSIEPSLRSEVSWSICLLDENFERSDALDKKLQDDEILSYNLFGACQDIFMKNVNNDRWNPA
jgi:hypothetical protein